MPLFKFKKKDKLGCGGSSVLSCPSPTPPDLQLALYTATVCGSLSGFLRPQGKHLSSSGQVTSARELMTLRSQLQPVIQGMDDKGPACCPSRVDVKAFATQSPRRSRPDAHRGDLLVNAAVLVSFLPHLTSPPLLLFPGITSQMNCTQILSWGSLWGNLKEPHR